MYFVFDAAARDGEEDDLLGVYDLMSSLNSYETQQRMRRDVFRGYHDYLTVAERLAPMGPWVEIGSGSGALAREIRSLGGRCVATDSHEWVWFRDDEQGPALWSKAHSIEAEAERVGRLVGRHPSLGLISAWPSYAEDWCFRAVRHLSVGQLFAYVGEGYGGCTGDDQLHDLLVRDFELMERVDIRQAPYVHDALYIYRRTAE